MHMIFKIVLSMSVSGSLFILALLMGKRFFKNTFSRQWQYYVWFLVILRLLLPFGPQISLMGEIGRTLNRAVTQEVSAPGQENSAFAVENVTVSADGSMPDIEKADQPGKTKGGERLWDGGMALLANYAGLIWLMTALGMLIRKITAYQGFVRYVTVGAAPVSDPTLLAELSEAVKQAGIDRRVKLCVNPLLSSPTLTGMFHSCIVLPCAAVSPKDFRYIVRHELTHCRRWDMLYKWLVQVVVCVHWFNPLVHVMSREIANACEFSCDEAVVARMGYENAQDYAKTLLDAMASVGKYRESSAMVSLSANKKLLRERLGAIMSCGKKSGTVRVLTAVLTAGIAFGVFFAGIYPVEAADRSASSELAAPAADREEVSPVKPAKEAGTGEAVDRIEEFYEAESLPLFSLAFDRLDEEAQSLWLDRSYQDGETAFFGAGVRLLNGDSPLIPRFAEKAYAEDAVSFFSVLADQMDEDTLEEWLDRAIADGKTGFQSMLLDRLMLDAEKDEWEKELEEKQIEEYRAAGVTMKGKKYYYQGQPVKIFLDMHSNNAFYTLNIDPAGTVNVKICRGEDGQITGAAYLTEGEVAELFGDEEE